MKNAAIWVIGTVTGFILLGIVIAIEFALYAMIFALNAAATTHEWIQERLAAREARRREPWKYDLHDDWGWPSHPSTLDIIPATKVDSTTGAGGARPE